MPSVKPIRWIPVAKILREWGIRGQVRAILFNPDSEIFFKQKKFFLEDEAQTPIQIQSAKPHGKFWILHLKGYDNPESTLSLRGAVLQLPREKLPKTEAQEVYLVDLEGLEVLGPEKEKLGILLNFQRVGESEIMMVGENSKDSVGVPYESDFVTETNIAQGYIQLTPLALDFFAIHTPPPKSQPKT